MRIAILTAEKREHEKDYTNPIPAFGTAPEALLQGFAEISGVEIHVLSCTRQPVAAPEKIADNIWYHNLHVPKIGWLRTGYQGCIRAMRKKLREIQPDIVHGQGTEHNNALCAIFSGFPNVITIHGNMRLVARVNRAKRFSFEWLAARLEAFTLPRTQGVVCITTYTRAAVAGLAKKTWLVPNAVDESFFDITTAPDVAAPPVGLCVGAISVRKNQNAFIRALDPLAQEKAFNLVFAGSTANDAYGREFLQLVQDRPWCKQAGFLNRAQLRAQFAAAAFVVLPTREDNCPMVVLEAMAAGVPVLASNVGGVPDLITPETTGLFCDPLRPETFAAGVARLLDDRALARRLAQTARAEALKRFHPQVIAQRHLEIYREVVGESQK